MKSDRPNGEESSPRANWYHVMLLRCLNFKILSAEGQVASLLLLLLYRDLPYIENFRQPKSTPQPGGEGSKIIPSPFYSPSIKLATALRSVNNSQQLTTVRMRKTRSMIWMIEAEWAENRTAWRATAAVGEAKKEMIRMLKAKRGKWVVGQDQAPSEHQTSLCMRTFHTLGVFERLENTLQIVIYVTSRRYLDSRR